MTRTVRNIYQSNPRRKSPVYDDKCEKQFAKSANILNITKKYRAQGIDLSKLPLSQISGSAFQDCTLRPKDYSDYCDSVNRVDQVFELLPSSVRDEFHNSPIEMLKFLDDPENRDRAVKLGLLKEIKSNTSEVSNPETATQKPSESSESDKTTQVTETQ